jgi:hypothetical protein
MAKSGNLDDLVENKYNRNEKKIAHSRFMR